MSKHHSPGDRNKQITTHTSRMEARGGGQKPRRRHDGDNRHAMEKAKRAQEVHAALLAEAAANGVAMDVSPAGEHAGGNGVRNGKRNVHKYEVASNEDFTIFMYAHEHPPMHVHIETHTHPPERARMIIVREDDGTFSCEPYPYKYRNGQHYAPEQRDGFTMEGHQLAAAKAFVKSKIAACMSLWSSHHGSSTPIRREELGEILQTPLFPTRAYAQEIADERQGADWLALTRRSNASGTYGK